jgi:MFS family permease
MSDATVPSSNALHYPRYIKQLIALSAHGFGAQIITTSVGWQVYELTRNPMDLAWIGLSQFLPALVLVLVTGLAADRFNRRLIAGLCLVLECIVAIGFVLFTLSGTTSVLPVYGLLALLGVARAFFNPASDALAPNLLSKEAIPHGISLGSMTWQLTSILGPVLGGLLFWWSGVLAYGVAAVLMAAGVLSVTLIGRVPQDNHAEHTTIETLLAGFKFILGEKIVLGAISLDLFAVLLGGAYALMPIYANDIFQTGAWGNGLLRAGPGIGALLMAAWLAKYGVRDYAGRAMFICVALFGAFTVVFGLSTSLPLSIFALIIMGAMDMVSVYVRETLMQLWTKDDVRGRVNAVNRVFIGASNELGEFRAGVVAARTSAVFAVTIGGAGTVAVAAIWAWMFPQLREARRLDGRKD